MYHFLYSQQSSFIVAIVKLLLANFYWIKPQLNYNYIENEHDILHIFIYNREYRSLKAVSNRVCPRHRPFFRQLHK